MKDKLHYIGLALLVAIAGVVYGLGIRLGLVHDYYSAAVYSMSQSWSAFLWGAVDGTSITLDKLPGAFWVQALSVRLFGFNDWALLLPQVAEALGAIVVTFFTVRRWLGATPGLIAAAGLAVTPIVAALAHSQISDTLLMFLLTLAAYAWTRAIEKTDWRWLALSGVIVGCAFQAKMAEAWGILPALALTYLLFGGSTWLRRLGHLAIAAISTAVSSLWWIVLATVVSDRPWIDGSTTNSAWEMVFQYNLSGRYDSSGSMSSMWDADVIAQAGWFYITAVLGTVIGLWATRKAPRTDLVRAALVMSTLWFATFFTAFSAGSVNHSYYVVALAPALVMMSVIGATLAWRSNRWLVACLAAATLGWAWWLNSQFELAQKALIVAMALVVLGGLGLLLIKRSSLAAPLAAVLLVGGALTTPAAWAVETINYSGNAHGPYAGTQSEGGHGPSGGGSPHSAPNSESDSKPESGSKPASKTKPSSQSGQSGQAQPLSHTKPAEGQEASSHESGSHGSGSQGRSGQGSGGPDSSASFDAATNLATIKQSQAGSTYDVAVIGYSAASKYISAGARTLFIGGYSGDANNVTLDQFKQLVADGEVTFIHLGGSGRGHLDTENAAKATEEISTWVQENFTEVSSGLYQLSASVNA